MRDVYRKNGAGPITEKWCGTYTEIAVRDVYRKTWCRMCRGRSGVGLIQRERSGTNTERSGVGSKGR